ncbi:MAG: acetylxylan esterase [Planctomycetaceae bacterium]|nr:acetylxylan esterase [Planctomycetaceae bacterium]
MNGMCAARLIMVVLVLGLGCWVNEHAFALQETPANETKNLEGNLLQLQKYFQVETRRMADRCLSDVQSAEDWLTRRSEYRRQLAEMLGLDPMPPRTALRPVVTGEVAAEGVIVERLHFQSLPGLYVTCNFYRPAEVKEPLPAILYLCGHARVAENGISYGNKTAYHHHGVWFARHGYVCLMLDTIQLGEIEGVHHGTYNLNQWWWNSRGYTPAGVEAWNGIRALDYLEQRPEVDAKRIGVTGRSGGGAYSWWVAALDERVAAAVPVAGITSLQNHVVDGCVEGHCDCMYPVNTYRWDFAQVAALIAPRPLLIANSDNDPIFPLEGVVEVHQKTRKIYRLLGADSNLGLNITPGPHTDTQELQVPAFRWFDQHLKKVERPIEMAALPLFEPQQLRVFSELPSDERVTTVAEFFVAPCSDTPLPVVGVPGSDESVSEVDADWLSLARVATIVQQQLQQKVFAGWPNADQVPTLNPKHLRDVRHDGVRFQQFEFTSQAEVILPLYVWDFGTHQNEKASDALLEIGDENQLGLLEAWTRLAADGSVAALSQAQRQLLEEHIQRMRQQSYRFHVWIVPRGIGPAAWTLDLNKLTQIRRRFMLLGQTLAGMQVWDVRQALATFSSIQSDVKLTVQAKTTMSTVVSLAALGRDEVHELILVDPPANHREAEDILNLARVVEPRQLAGLLLSQGTNVTISIAPDRSRPWFEVAEATDRLRLTRDQDVGKMKVQLR